jgi:sulfur-oxidizing protein SoxX
MYLAMTTPNAVGGCGMKRRFHAWIVGASAAVALLLVGSQGQADEVVNYEVVDGSRIPQPLTDEPGDAIRGRTVAIDRKKGNCLACHAMPVPDQAFHGEIGPPLDGVGSRFDAAELRLRIVNPKVINPDTSMPAFYRTEGLHMVMKDFEGKTILSAQEVEDVVAYLMTLQE